MHGQQAQDYLARSILQILTRAAGEVFHLNNVVICETTAASHFHALTACARKSAIPTLL